MLDTDTFLTALYVSADDFCKTYLLSPPPSPPSPPSSRGPAASLSCSETITLALFGQLARFGSERDFFRFATARLRHLFPRLPDRSQFNRLQREHQETLLAFSRYIATSLWEKVKNAHGCLDSFESLHGFQFEVMDRCGIATRWASRRGVGWLPEFTDKGYCSRLGYFHGFSLLTAVTPEGIITGFCVGAASAKDQPLAEALLWARSVEARTGTCEPRCPFAGPPLLEGYYGYYLADSGFVGAALHQHWLTTYGALVQCPGGRDKRRPNWWPRLARRWHAAKRQIIESVHDKLLNDFRLARERPHEIRGFFARLSAKVALHNFCIWINCLHGRPLLQFADLLDW